MSATAFTPYRVARPTCWPYCCVTTAYEQAVPRHRVVMHTTILCQTTLGCWLIAELAKQLPPCQTPPEFSRRSSRPCFTSFPGLASVLWEQSTSERSSSIGRHTRKERLVHGRKVPTWAWDPPLLWQVKAADPAPGRAVAVAGQRLYGARARCSRLLTTSRGTHASSGNGNATER